MPHVHRTLPEPLPRVPEVSLVLPFHDEFPIAVAVASDALSAGRALGVPFELLLVDDGSRDGTGEALEAAFGGSPDRLPDVRLLRHESNRGYGASLRTGFQAAQGTWVAFSDGDGQFDFADLAELVRKRAPRTIVAGRRSPRRDGPARRAAGALWSLAVRSALGVRVQDVNCAFKLFPRELIAERPLRRPGPGINAELLLRAKRAGLEVVELPVRHLPRRAGRASGLRPRVVLAAFRELAALSLDARRPSEAARGPGADQSARIRGGAADSWA